MRVYLPFLNKTRGRRVLLSVIILGASFAVSAYLVLTSTSGDKNAGGALGIETPAASTLSQNLKFVRAAPNLTDEFTNRAVETLITKNQSLKESDGANPQDYSLLPGKTDVAAIVSKIIDDELATEQIKISDLNVNSSNSKETQLAYLLFANYIIETQAEVLGPRDPTQSLTNYFSATAAEFERTAELLKVVNVPSSWLQIHRDLVAFFLKQRNIYRSLAAANIDPLRFMIAFTRLFPAETEREFQKIQAKIEQKIVDEKLI